jgi:hypothetical protein
MYLEDLQYNRITCGEILAETTGDAIANQGGDSGGPVTRNASGNTYAVGTVSAAQTNTTTTCTYYAATTCYTTLYYVPIGPILSEWGATLNL